MDQHSDNGEKYQKSLTLLNIPRRESTLLCDLENLLLHSALTTLTIEPTKGYEYIQFLVRNDAVDRN